MSTRPLNKLILILSALLAGPALAWSKVELKSISVKSEGGRTVVSGATSAKAEVKLEPAGDKLILHLPGATRKNMAELAVGSQGVKKIRFGMHGDVLRVVMDLDGPAKPKLLENGEAGFKLELGSSPAPRKAASKETAAAQAESSPLESVQSMAPAQSGLTYRIVDVSLVQGGEKTQLVISADGPVSYKPSVRENGKVISITFRNSSLAWSAPEEPLAAAGVEKVGARQVSVKGESQVRVDLELKQKLPYTIDRDQNQVLVAVEKPQQQAAVPAQGNLDTRVSLDLEQADLVGTLKNLAAQAGFECDFTNSLMNMSAEQRMVTVRVVNRPLREVFTSLLANYLATYYQQGNRLLFGNASEISVHKKSMPKVNRFYTPRYLDAAVLLNLVKSAGVDDPTFEASTVVLADPKDSEGFMVVGTEGDVSLGLALLRKFDVPESGEAGAGDDDSADSGGSRKTKVYKLRYLDSKTASLLTTGIEQVIPKEAISKGTFAYNFDPGTRTLIATGRLKHLKKVDVLLSRIDQKRPQVQIEGKIAEVNQDDAKALGVNLSYDTNTTSGTNYALGQVLGTPARRGIGVLTVINTQNLSQISARLEALVQKNSANIISSPSITTQDNVKATIETVDNVILQKLDRQVVGEVITDTITFTERPVPLKLEVTPKISVEDQVIEMTVDFTLENITGEPASQNAPPPTTKQTTHTLVSVSNSQTAVIGGMIRDSMTSSVDKVPVLGDIPLLGLLFRRELTTKKKKEVIIFITPTIVED